MMSGFGRLMPGFRFHPTDEELVMYYLKRKVMGKKMHGEIISELDIYKFEPSELPDKSCLKSRDLNWYFFCPRGNKYPSGGRANRATQFGYWKATGNDRSVSHKDRTVGKIKTLIFHRGKPPKGERTDWVLHEYRLDDNTLVAGGVVQDSYVICKIFHKSGLGPKNGEQYGAPFVEEEWEDDETECASTLPPARCDFANDANTASSGHYGLGGNDDAVETDTGGLGQANSNLITVDDDGIDELDRILAMFIDNDDTTMKKTETAEPPPAEVGGDVFAELEDFCDWGGLGQNSCLQSPWWENYLDENLYLELDDLV